MRTVYEHAKSKSFSRHAQIGFLLAAVVLGLLIFVGFSTVNIYAQEYRLTSIYTKLGEARRTNDLLLAEFAEKASGRAADYVFPQSITYLDYPKQARIK